MTTSFYYQNPLGSITYDPRGFISLTWFDALIIRSELHSLYARTIQALRHHNTCKLLTNQVNRQPLPAEEQEWIIQQWIPQAIAECAYSHWLLWKARLSSIVKRPAPLAIA